MPSEGGAYCISGFPGWPVGGALVRAGVLDAGGPPPRTDTRLPGGTGLAGQRGGRRGGEAGELHTLACWSLTDLSLSPRESRLLHSSHSVVVNRAHHAWPESRSLTLSVDARSADRLLFLTRVAPAERARLGQSDTDEAAAFSRAERRVAQTVATALVVGAALGGYLGYQFGNWRAARRAARATYRTQRGLR
jgi:hypothetical protein